MIGLNYMEKDDEQRERERERDGRRSRSRKGIILVRFIHVWT
jgi:hypothetical protein